MTRVRTWAPWTIVVLIAGGALAFAQTASGHTLLRHLGVSARPDRYAALSFTDVSGLPYSVVTGRRVSLPIRIDNHRGSATDFTVTVAGSGTTRAAGTRAVTVPDAGSRTLVLDVAVACTVPTAVQTPASLPTARVVVSIAPTGESITHTMFCRAAS